jgi:hypothetical protein
MTPIILWVLLAVIQGQGGQAEFFGTIADCQDARTLILRQSHTLAVSECTTIALHPVLPTS